MKSLWACGLLALAACRNAPPPAADTAPREESRARPSDADAGANPETPLAEFSERELARILTLSPLPPPPPDPTNRVYEDPRAARFGQALFYDPRLSADGSTSCATCHDPRQQWVDGKPLSEGVTRLDRHAPSIWNAAHQRWFFWDGRADSLWSQALVPLEHPLEHAGTRLEIAHVLYRDPDLRRAYEELFGSLAPLEDTDRFPAEGRPVSERELAWIEALAERNQEAGLAPEHRHRGGAHFTHPHQRAWDTLSEEDQDFITRVFTNVGKSLAAFERQIVAGQSAFDRFVAGLRGDEGGDLSALDPSAQRGLALFVGRAQCHVCHQGPTFSDREFHDIGVPPSDAVELPDPGRQEGLAQLLESPFNGNGRWSDDPDGVGRERIEFLPLHAHGAGREFKTPSLRNVALTAPYMHQGQMPTLESVLEHYSTVTDTPENVLKPLNLSPRERRDLIRFLESLTDTAIDEALLGPPPTPF